MRKKYREFVIITCNCVPEAMLRIHPDTTRAEKEIIVRVPPCVETSILQSVFDFKKVSPNCAYSYLVFAGIG